jgi:DNA-binding IclR family transcriptional regulator
MASRAAIRDNGTLSSVEKALAIIEFVGEHGPTSLAKIVAESGLPKSTVFRLLATICNAGFLERTARGEYAATIKFWRIGARAIDYRTIHPVIVETLNGLVDETSETAHFSIYEDGHAVYVEKVEGSHPVRAYTHVGGRSPAYASATGKALLAHQPEAEIERVADAAAQHTAKSIRGRSALIKEMEEVRRTGVAVNHGEWRDGVWGVASPIFDFRGDLAGAIGVSGPEARIAPALDKLTRLVQAHALRLTERYGGIRVDRAVG